MDEFGLHGESHVRFTQGDKTIRSKEEFCRDRAELEDFSLLRSNQASDSGQPSFISMATGTGEASLISTSIFPCKEDLQWDRE